ncbi:hypothetical protein MTO96_010000 [Rhipicephalus appendiculatus]
MSRFHLGILAEHNAEETRCDVSSKEAEGWERGMGDEATPPGQAMGLRHLIAGPTLLVSVALLSAFCLSTVLSDNLFSFYFFHSFFILSLETCGGSNGPANGLRRRSSGDSYLIVSAGGGGERGKHRTGRDSPRRGLSDVVDAVTFPVPAAAASVQ